MTDKRRIILNHKAQQLADEWWAKASPDERKEIKTALDEMFTSGHPTYQIIAGLAKLGLEAVLIHGEPAELPAKETS